MASKSLWMDVDVAPDALSLNGAAECDVVVVGSGIAGISTAYELSKRGKTVMVIDRGHICGGMTSRTSAHLAPLCDDLVSEMTRIKGRDATKLFATVKRLRSIASRRFRKRKKSIAISGGWTAIYSRVAICQPIPSIRRWTRCATSEPRFTD